MVCQYAYGPRYLDRFEALNRIATDYDDNSKEAEMMEQALNDKFWNIRLTALKNIGEQLKANKDRLKRKVLEMAAHDDKSQVREQALRTLNRYLKQDTTVKAAVESALKDSSYL